MNCTKKYRMYLLFNGSDCKPLCYGTYKFYTYEQYITLALIFVHNWLKYTIFDERDVDFDTMKSGFNGHHSDNKNRLFTFKKTKHLNNFGFSEYIYPLFVKFDSETKKDGCFVWLEDEKNENEKVNIKYSNLIMCSDYQNKEENFVYPYNKIINEKEEWIDKTMEIYYDLNGYGEIIVNSPNLNDRIFKLTFTYEDTNCYNDYIYIIKLFDEEQKWEIVEKIKSKNVYVEFIKIFVQLYKKLPLKTENGFLQKCPDYIYSELGINKNNVGKKIILNDYEIDIDKNMRYECIITHPRSPTPKLLYPGVFIWNKEKVINVEDITLQLRKINE